MTDESPVAAVTRVLENQFSIKNPGNVRVMILIDAVADSIPPPRDMTIASLRSILRTMEPHQALEGWAHRSSIEIVKIISQHPNVREAAKLVNDERLWDELEGITCALLMRVARGQDLEDEWFCPVGHKACSCEGARWVAKSRL